MIFYLLAEYGLNVGWISINMDFERKFVYFTGKKHKKKGLRKNSNPSSCQCEYDFIKHLGGIIHIIIYNKT